MNAWRVHALFLWVGELGYGTRKRRRSCALQCGRPIPIERCRRSPGADRPADLVGQGSSPQGSVQPDRIDHHTKVIALQNICWAASMSSRYPRRQGNVCPMRCLRSRRCLALRAIPTGQDSLTRPVQIHVQWSSKVWIQNQSLLSRTVRVR